MAVTDPTVSSLGSITEWGLFFMDYDADNTEGGPTPPEVFANDDLYPGTDYGIQGYGGYTPTAADSWSLTAPWWELTHLTFPALSTSTQVLSIIDQSGDTYFSHTIPVSAVTHALPLIGIGGNTGTSAISSAMTVLPGIMVPAGWGMKIAAGSANDITARLWFRPAKRRN